MEKYFLKPHLTLEITDSNIKIIGDKIYRISPVSDSIKGFFDKLQKKGLTLEEVDGELENNSFKIIFSLLQEKSFITNHKNNYQNTFLEKQVDFFISLSDHPIDCQVNIVNSTVLILGCGGIGHIVVQHLLASGVNSFILIDADCVENNNLNRQFCFEESDIGKYKTEALANYIYKRNHQAIVECHNIYLNTQEAFQSINLDKSTLFVCAADEPKFILQELVVKNCMKYKLPVVFAGVGFHRGFVGPLLRDLNECNRYLKFINKYKSSPKNTKPLIPSICYTNTFVGTFLSKEIIYFLSGHLKCTILGMVHLLDLENMTIISSETI